jgi:hypothetical protein
MRCDMSILNRHVPSRRAVAAGAQSRRHALCTLSASVVCASLVSPALAEDTAYSFDVQQYGEKVSMSKYEGKALIIVNVASE